MISIIICSINNDKFATISANYAQLLANEPHEIIRISDAKSMCEGYNRGLAQSTGDILIFSHDDVEFLAPDFAARLKSYLQSYDIIGVAGTTLLAGPTWIYAGHPHIFGQIAQVNAKENAFDISIFATPRRIIPDIRALDGCFLAFRRSAIEQIGWDEKTFTDFHLYDIDTTYRAHRAGLRLAVACDLHIIHASSGAFNNEVWRKYAVLFLQKHSDIKLISPRPRFIIGGIHAATKQEAAHIMTPTYWLD